MDNSSWDIRDLSPSDQYALGVACSGPGHRGAYVLKHIITARIRHVTYQGADLYEAMTRSLGKQVSWEFVADEAQVMHDCGPAVRQMMRHWLWHSMAGLKILEQAGQMPATESTLLFTLCKAVRQRMGVSILTKPIDDAVLALEEYYRG